MTGLDFIGALQANQIDLPIRVFVSGEPMRNLYRPDALSFANVTIDEDEDVSPESLAFLCGKTVYIVGDEATDKIRSLTKTIKAVEPGLLVVAAGEVFTTWKHGRGWL